MRLNTALSPAPAPGLLRRCFLWLLTLAVGACTTASPRGQPESAAAPAPQATADARTGVSAALGVETRWLQSWFKDTPVRIEQRSDGAVTVEVPVAFCFDVGRSSVKPALAAVLDKVAESMRRVPTLRLPLLAAPGGTTGAAGTSGTGTSGSAALALQRAQQMQKHLQNRGVAAARLGPPTASTEAAVQLRLEAAPPP